MKGVVFREFLNHVEERFGEDAVDDVIEAANLESGASYTGVGTYHHAEMVALVTALSEQVSIPTTALMWVFAEHLMAYFASAHPAFFVEAGDSLSFIEKVDSHIHVEVRKLYPQAELPEFTCRRRSENTLELVYRSSRPFADLAHGLLLATGGHFGEVLEVERVEGHQGPGVPFVVRRKEA